MTDTSIDQIVEQLPTVVRRPLISKTLRFEVFKRDSFTCQYCGRRAPDVALHCDHVKPLVEGGEHNILNLTTACVDCNLGKGPRELSDQAVLSKQLNQLAALQERKEQMEMMIEWQKQLSNIDEFPVTQLEEQWREITGTSWIETGKAIIRKLIKKCGVELVTKAMRTSTDQYIERTETGKATEESVEKCFDSIGAIASVERAEQREPGSRRMFFIRGGLRRRLNYCPEGHALSLIRAAFRSGVSLDYIGEIASEARSWTQFRTTIEDVTAEAQEQAVLQAEWRASICQKLSIFSSHVSEDALINLISRAREVGMSEKYLLAIAPSCREWHIYKSVLECAIGWRSRILEPLRSTLGGYLPDEEELDYIHEAITYGLSEDSILEMAGECKDWPKLKPLLIEATNTLEQVAFQKYREGEEQRSLTSG